MPAQTNIPQSDTAGSSPRISAIITSTTSSQTIPDATISDITFNSVVHDSGGFFSVSTPTRLTAPVNGIYYVWGSLSHAFSVLGNNRAAGIAKNGNIQIDGKYYAEIEAAMTLAASNSPTAYTPSAIAKLAAGDYVTLWGYQNSGGAATILDYPALGIFLVETY